ncbi:uncharacterized protein LOC127135990 [Lathyrus oleraceus]|uniref:uncharacterized protein LOC127135990 n=1 Tax=Pisum sativum TaxID=3888 RepID=UPI0021D0F4F4|nr:uncharacterized protein LOC127135990 [Pisum sativum]
MRKIVNCRVKSQYQEPVEVINLGSKEVRKEVKIGASLVGHVHSELVKLLHEYVDVFVWSYKDMPKLDTNIVEHHLPLNLERPLVKQKLRITRPDMTLKIREEVKKQFDVGFLVISEYPQWVANIVPISKKDGKVKMVQPDKMSPDDMEKTTFITLWATYYYKVMPFGLKNAEETYQRAMVTLFHDMIHKDIEVYMDDMISKSKTEDGLLDHLRNLFTRLRMFKLRLSPAKCTFGVQYGKLLGFIVSHKSIEVAFDKIKKYLQEPLILIPHVPGRPRIVYLTVLDESMGCVLGQHDDTGRKEHAIYYLSKNFTERETRYSLLEKTYCALAWAARRLRQYMYTTQKAIKGSVFSDYLAHQPMKGYQLMRFDFLDEDILFIRDYVILDSEEGPEPGSRWTLMFDGASNARGHRIGALVTSPTGFHLSSTARLSFDCTNNMAEYEVCIYDIEATINLRIKILEVYEDSALVINQVKGYWETRDSKLIPYREHIMKLICYFDEISFHHIPREDNQLENALATLTSMFKVKWRNEAHVIHIDHLDEPSQCLVIEADSDDKPWFYDIKRYLEKQEYPEGVSITDKKALRRLCSKFFLNGDIYSDKIHMTPSPLNVLTSPLPFSMWGIDMIGIIEPRASNGHRFILVVINYITKWVEVASYANVTRQMVT